MCLECGLGHLPLIRGIFIRIFLLTFVFYTLKITLNIIIRENYNSIQHVWSACSYIVYDKYIVYSTLLICRAKPLLWPPLHRGKLRLRAGTSLLGTSHFQLVGSYLTRESAVYRVCSLYLLHSVLFLRKRQSRIKCVNTRFLFLKRKATSRFCSEVNTEFSTQSSLLLDPQTLKWKLMLKRMMPGRDPPPENSDGARHREARSGGPESRWAHITEILLWQLKAEGNYFNQSSYLRNSHVGGAWNTFHESQDIVRL